MIFFKKWGVQQKKKNLQIVKNLFFPLILKYGLKIVKKASQEERNKNRHFLNWVGNHHSRYFSSKNAPKKKTSQIFPPPFFLVSKQKTHPLTFLPPPFLRLSLFSLFFFFIFDPYSLFVMFFYSSFCVAR